MTFGSKKLVTKCLNIVGENQHLQSLRICGIMNKMSKKRKEVNIMSQALPKGKMYRYCLADVAKGLFNGMIGNYLL